MIPNKPACPLILLLLFALPVAISAQDTTRIISHDHIKVVTDESKGENSYPATVEFPKPGLQFRRVNMLVTFQCPDNMQCGEWDYIDYVNLKTTDPATGNPASYEIARLITPYGRFFGTKWFFTFKADISEFSTLLRNKATIEYVHSGYESAVTCGWKITVTFEFISGPPVANILSVVPMWNGSFPYGDSTNDIEKYLTAKKVTATDKTGLMRLRVIQTGHGMDDQDNCAEFCSKWREIYFDKRLAEHRDIWKECGTNPVYPQAGTWVYDRANWCPGCMVKPETFDFVVKPGSTHVINIDMQPYKVVKGKPSANYVFSSFLVMCEKPRAANDAAIEAIIAPSTDENYSRLNPIGTNPRIIIRNNGYKTLKSLKIRYGLPGQIQNSLIWKGNLAAGKPVGDSNDSSVKIITYNWNDSLEYGKTREILLPGRLGVNKETDLFTVTISEPNGRKDEYDGDNRMSSVMMAPPVYPEKFIVVFKTNRDSVQNKWGIDALENSEAGFLRSGSFRPNTEYRDTVSLPAGQYQFHVSDTEGDGLEFWANPRGGMGMVKLVSMDGKLIRTFGSDFGSTIRHSFEVGGSRPLAPFQDAFVMVYPHRPTQNTTLMLFFNDPQTVKGKLTLPDGKVLQEMQWNDVREGNFTIDLSNYPDGIYMLELKYGLKTESIRLKKAARR
jgi:hypothetical protein